MYIDIMPIVEQYVVRHNTNSLMSHPGNGGTPPDEHNTRSDSLFVCLRTDLHHRNNHNDTVNNEYRVTTSIKSELTVRTMIPDMITKVNNRSHELIDTYIIRIAVTNRYKLRYTVELSSNIANSRHKYSNLFVVNTVITIQLVETQRMNTSYSQ